MEIPPSNKHAFERLVMENFTACLPILLALCYLSHSIFFMNTTNIHPILTKKKMIEEHLKAAGIFSGSVMIWCCFWTAVFAHDRQSMCVSLAYVVVMFGTASAIFGVLHTVSYEIFMGFEEGCMDSTENERKFLLGRNACRPSLVFKI
jgi:hypothetical protein